MYYCVFIYSLVNSFIHSVMFLFLMLILIQETLDSIYFSFADILANIVSVKDTLDVNRT